MFKLQHALTFHSYKRIDNFVSHRRKNARYHVSRNNRSEVKLIGKC